ncbi:retinal rod cell development [Balamuthia mandrillaris]
MKPHPMFTSGFQFGTNNNHISPLQTHFTMSKEGFKYIKKKKTVRLVNQNTGQSLRGFADGHVDGKGKQGPRTQWTVEEGEGGTYLFKNVKTGKYLRISKESGKLDCEGTGGPQCRFTATEKDGKAVLQSQKLGHRIGILPDGSPKEPAKVGEGRAALFTVVKVKV